MGYGKHIFIFCFVFSMVKPPITVVAGRSIVLFMFHNILRFCLFVNSYAILIIPPLKERKTFIERKASFWGILLFFLFGTHDLQGLFVFYWNIRAD